jgi:predicted small lipoprotein YifL
VIRASVVALALVASAACGKYGPPVRAAASPSSGAPAVSAPPAAGDTEACPDPNAPAQPAGTTP